MKGSHYASSDVVEPARPIGHGPEGTGR